MQTLNVAAQQEQVSKLLTQVQKLGANLDKMQGTTRVIYDRQNFNGLKQYSFFELVKSKTFPATNLEENRLQPGEAMVVKEIFILFNRTSGTVGMDFSDLFRLNIQIGNNLVVKDLSALTMGYGRSGIYLNPINFSLVNQNPGNPNFNGYSLRLINNIVIPPQVQFKVNLELAVARGDVNEDITVYLKGYGKLFNPRNNY